MKQTYILLKLVIIILLAGGYYSCTKDLNDHKPIDNDGIAPAAVSNVKVQNKPGAAVITYTAPKDNDLQYVLAEYAINETTKRQAKTSRYNDTIFVDGFNRAGEYEVTLYAVDKGENKSDAVIVKVNPETPPYRNIAATLAINQDFGGINFTFDNVDEEKIAAVVVTKDNNGEFVPVETYYTQIKEASFSVRGYDTTERTFGVYIKDRWNNFSDTLFKTVTPFYETIMDKTKFRRYSLPLDQPSAWGWEMTALWDGVINQDYGFHTAQGAEPRPHRFTFDMGIVAKLSRFKLLSRVNWDPGYYGHGSPRLWTMWGTEDIPNPDGSWDGWTKLMDCESIKPSGSGPGMVTDEDKAHARGVDGWGEEFTFPLSAPRVRFIRMEIHENWSGTDFFHAYEITFWGDPR